MNECVRYKVYKVKPTTEEHKAFLKNFEQHPDVDFWTELRHLSKNVDVMISPAFQAQFEEQLTQKGIDYSIKINNVEE